MIASAGSRAGRVPVLAKYDVLEELGHGGMATVYRAHDKRLARDVAVKVLHPHLRENGEIAHRFAVEAKAVAKLRHPNIVEVFDVSSEQENEQYLVVELVRGPTLRKLLADRGVMPPEVGAALVLELLAGVAHAHASGVVHRDVKPENVLIEHRASRAPVSAKDPMPSSSASPSAPSGDRLSVKLTDFGIAKLLDAQGVTSTGQVLGSPAHMAPEQIEGGEVDGRADVFGLGVLFYECIVGHLPFQGNNPAQVLRRVLDGVYAPAERERPIVGKRWSQILDRALARNADDRYPDAGAMRDAIAAELGRLELASSRNTLEAWLEDPASADDTRLVERLVQLGHAARKNGEAVAAAGDFNRALAYAPNDPTLLRIVSSMHRSEARARIVRRTAPLVVGALLLGTSAYAVARAFKAPPPPVPTPSSSTTPSAAASTPATVATQIAIPAPEASTATSASGGRTVATPTALLPTKPIVRTFGFAKLRPPYGVRTTIDGALGPELDVHSSFTLDEKPHTVVFSCANDLCVPQTHNIAAGDKDEMLSVELVIPPARLLVEGDSSHSYGIEELPGLTLAAGQEAEIPMSAGDRSVNVFDRNDPSKRQLVRLGAGKSQTVSFRR
jgi:eukaryotic-like serine/threonine-protein kinase